MRRGGLHIGSRMIYPNDTPLYLLTLCVALPQHTALAASDRKKQHSLFDSLGFFCFFCCYFCCFFGFSPLLFALLCSCSGGLPFRKRVKTKNTPLFFFYVPRLFLDSLYLYTQQPASRIISPTYARYELSVRPLRIAPSASASTCFLYAEFP